MKYQPVIGLEVHVELKTKSKMFCRCSADYFGQTPNTLTCPVCLGMPGALPVPNTQAIDWCIMIGIALNCSINTTSKFDRKNYFYPDLAKGYQISQYDQPFCKNGSIEVRKDAKSQEKKKIRIRRVHMEEDTGKLIHETVDGENVSLIDFNRSGVPLVEIVTEPDFENAFQVTEYLQELQRTVRYLDVSNADMEKGDMRLEPNISLRKREEKDLPSYKVEVKNINSFRFVAKAIETEVVRQEVILEKGETPLQETRGWNDIKGTTVSQRLKEEANDYRYFPEPDIPPIVYTDTQISTIKSRVPELREEKLDRLVKLFALSYYDAEIITREKSVADYFEEAVHIGAKHNVSPKQIANAIINKKVDIDKDLPATLVKQIVSSSQIAQIDESELLKVINIVLNDNQKAVEDFKNGKENVIMFLVGQVMSQFTQKIDAMKVKQALLNRLK